MSAPPTFDLQDLLGKTLPCSCDTPHRIHTQAIVMHDRALEQVAACCEQHLSGKRSLLVVDEITYAVAGQRVKEALAQTGYRVESLVLPAPAESPVMADDEMVTHVRAAMRPEIDFIVAVGAGTVNDVAKLASFQADRPYVVCPTAPSVNGFTSAIAALMSQGVKRTVPAHLPVAVVADLEILAAAPASMRRAGLGDMLSKPVSNADWKLAHLIKGGYYCDLPIRMVEAAERACRDHAVAIGSGAAKGVNALTEALLLSGFSMAIAGSSSPASGGEHLLSHYWDMTAHWHRRPKQLHGAQVGVATLVTATLYEKLRQLDPTTIDLAALRRHYPSWENLERTLRHNHGSLAAAVVAEARKKYLLRMQKEREWAFILEHWDTLWQDLTPLLIPAASIREVLLAAGAPTTVHELGISVEELRTAFLHAKDIRGRYTILDFAHDLGVLEAMGEEVLHDSGVLD